MAPPKLTLQTIKDRYEKYGYIILSDKYINNKQKLDVYDTQLGKKIRLTTQELDYRCKHWDREYVLQPRNLIIDANTGIEVSSTL